MSPPPTPLHSTFGALFIGAMLANTLLGISMVQAFYYYRHQADPWSIKLLVTAVLIFDIFHQALISHTVYTYTITNWGNDDILGTLISTLIIENVPNSLTALLVQGFLTARVWRLSHGNIVITAAIALLVLGEFGAILSFTIIALQYDTFAQLVRLKPLSLSVNILAAAGDVLIAAALCYLLNRSRTGFQRSESLINKLILFAMNTGLLTSICAVASFISYIASPNAMIYVLFYFCLGRLYTNSLLATLNARKMIRNGSDNVHNSDRMTLSLRDLPRKGGPVSRQFGPSNISIKIDTTQEYVTDLAVHGEHDHDSEKTESFQKSDLILHDQRTGNV